MEIVFWKMFTVLENPADFLDPVQENVYIEKPVDGWRGLGGRMLWL